MRLGVFRLLSAALLLAVSGCDKQPVGAEIRLDEQSDDFVMAKVGATGITLGDFRRRQAFEEAIWRYHNATRPPEQFERGLQAFRVKRTEMIMGELINSQLIYSYAKNNRLELDENEIKTTVMRFLGEIHFRGTPDRFAETCGVDRVYMERQACKSAQIDKVCKGLYPESFSITEAEVDDGLRNQADYYRRAVESNAVTYATCSNVMKRIRSGMDFAEAGLKFGVQPPKECTTWGTFIPSELEDPKLREWAFKAKVGSMAAFDIDDGLSIVKILGRTEGAVVESVVSVEDSQVTLARINFAMVEPEPEPRTREYVRKTLLGLKQDEARKKLFAMLMEKIPVTYPNGENLIMKGMQ